MNKDNKINRRGFLGYTLLATSSMLACPFSSKAVAQPELEQSSNPFACPPYLLNLISNGITVMWVMDRPDYTCWVEYGESEQLGIVGRQSVNGQFAANQLIQKVRLENLNPGKRYYYRVVAKEIKKYEAYHVEYGPELKSDIFSFTIPEEDRPSTSFLVFNDLHQKPANMEYFLKQEENYDFVVFNGDILNHIHHENIIVDSFLKPASQLFASQKPLFYTRGNHETRGPMSRQLIHYLDSPNGHFYYTFSFGPVFGIVCDGGEDKPDDNQYYYGLADYDGYRSQQAQWLQQVLKSKEARRAPFCILFNHIPVSLEKGDGWHGTMELQKKWAPLVQNKVDLIISGHTHAPKIIRPAKGLNSMPVLIGGGPDLKKNATCIRLDVSKKGLKGTILNSEGVLDEIFLKG